MGVPSTSLEVQPGEGRNGTAQRVSHQDQLVMGILVQSLGYMWQDDLTGVEPRGIEAGMYSTVVAFGRLGGWRIVVYV